MYYGWGLGRDFRSKLMAPVYNMVMSILFSRPKSEIKNTKPSIMSCAVVEMEDDMITVKGNPKSVLDSKTTAHKGSLLYNHAFYEAPSIRKFGNLYYLVYSSGENNELAYATSKYPDHGFQYRGVIISNSDLGLNGNTQAKFPAGTIHGGIECINGKYYVFYHRSTNNTDFSRQTCAEEIEILPDGTIYQVEITSCGMNNGPLIGEGTYPAAICCNLYGNEVYKLGNKTGPKYPRVFEENNQVFVHDIWDGTVVGYKYFALRGDEKISLAFRGEAEGALEIYAQSVSAENYSTMEEARLIGNMTIDASERWIRKEANVILPKGRTAIYFKFRGSGKFDLLEILFS